MKSYFYLGAHRLNTCETARAILIAMEHNLSDTCEQIIWMANQNRFDGDLLKYMI